MALTAQEKHAKLQQERAFLTGLLEAALKGQFAELERLVEDYSLRQSIPKETVLLQFRDGQGKTALHFACHSRPAANSNEKDILEDLLCGDWLSKTCVSQLIRLQDSEGLTPLMLAAQLSDRDLCERRVLLLLQAAGDQEVTGSSKGTSTAGDYVLLQSRSGATALHYAASASASSTTIHALCRAAPTAISIFSQQGGAPLHWACASAETTHDGETIAALLDCGADWNGYNQTAFPPLAYALATNHAARAKSMLQQAMERNIDTSKTLQYILPGETTVYHMAADLNMVGVLALLLELLPDPALLERRNSRKLTARELAAVEGNLGCVLLLMPPNEQTEEQALAFIQETKLSQLSVSDEAPKQQNLIEKPFKDEPEPNEMETQAQHEALRIAGMDVTDDLKDQAARFKTEGNAHFARKEYRQAIDCYTHAIESDPTDATFYSNRSACYINLQEPSSALKDAVICRYLKPDWPKAAYRMAIARLELGRYEDAALAAWEGLQKDQDNDELKSLLQKCVKLGRKQHKASQK